MEAWKKQQMEGLFHKWQNLKLTGEMSKSHFLPSSQSF